MVEHRIHVQLNIFNSGGGEYGYSIEVIGNKITCRLKELGVENGEFALKDTIVEYSDYIENNNFKQLQSELNIFEEIEKNDSIAKGLGVYTYSFEIDGQRHISFTSSQNLEEDKYEELNKLKRLTKLLIDISPMKIDYSKT